jgi:hypothetical protein
LPHGYCTECRAQVTVRDGQCLLDHIVDPSTIEETPGRRLRPTARRRRGTHHARPSVRRELGSVDVDPRPLGGGLALLEREPDVGFEDSLSRLDRTPLRPAAPTTPEPTRLAPVTDADTLSVTGLLVEELWNLSPDEDIIGWTPGELDETLVRTGVRKRKVVAIGALVVVALLVGWRALTWDDANTAAAIDAVTAASAELVSGLGAAAGPASDLSDGIVEDPLAASTALARLDETARTLFAVAGDMGDNSELAPIREQAITQAAGALDLGTTLSESMSYASAVHLITRPIDLPTETDIEGLAGVTEAVTGWVSDFTNGVNALPSNDLTDTHREGMAVLATSLPDWQAAYLDSLRARDAERAAGHIAELETQIRFVQKSWSDAAASIGDWADEYINALAVPLMVNR